MLYATIRKKLEVHPDVRHQSADTQYSYLVCTYLLLLE